MYTPDFVNAISRVLTVLDTPVVPQNSTQRSKARRLERRANGERNPKPATSPLPLVTFYNERGERITIPCVVFATAPKFSKSFSFTSRNFRM
jgi:hypothetical protein